MTPEDLSCFRALAEPFDWCDVEIKVQSVSKDKSKALPVAYLNARSVRRRLNECFGHANWDAVYREVHGEANKLIGAVCKVTVNLPSGATVTREEVGTTSDIEPVKGAFSDAIKRVFASLGHDHLYSINLGWHPITDNKFKPFSPEVLSRMQKIYEQAMASALHKSDPIFDAMEEHYSEDPPVVTGNGAARLAERMGVAPKVSE